MADEEYKEALQTIFTMKPYDHSKGGAQKIVWVCGHCGEECSNNTEFAHATRKHNSKFVDFRQGSAI